MQPDPAQQGVRVVVQRRPGHRWIWERDRRGLVIDEQIDRALAIAFERDAVRQSLEHEPADVIAHREDGPDRGARRQRGQHRRLLGQKTGFRRFGERCARAQYRHHRDECDGQQEASARADVQARSHGSVLPSPGLARAPADPIRLTLVRWGAGSRAPVG